MDSIGPYGEYPVIETGREIPPSRFFVTRSDRMLPTRKKHRLDKELYSQAGAYFITVCVNERKPILSTIVGADDLIGPQIQLSKIGMVVEKYTRLIPGVGAYVIMPNHIHMMLHISVEDGACGPMWSSAPTSANVQSLVRTWKTLITKELGESIWQRSYYDHIIRSEQDYIQICEYIHNNPAKWCEDRYYPGY